LSAPFIFRKRGFSTWRTIIVKAAVIAVGFLVSVSAVAAPPHVTDGMLVDEHGMTLYVFSGPGAPDVKACEGDCERNFPPSVAQSADEATGAFALLPMRSGGRQWAYKGKRLYNGAMDKKPGDTHGDGLNTVWHVVRVR
jgi:predicted lipoprotein with Yx(FWY)xxD motif